jgi:hypothetical protein
MSPQPPAADDPSRDDLVAPSTEEHPVLQHLERAGEDARWHMSRHTLELAIRAIESDVAPPAAARGTAGKSRRRKRRKRLL